MPNVIGFLLCVGFAWFDVDAHYAGERIASALFVLALVATLLELLREGRKG